MEMPAHMPGDDPFRSMSPTKALKVAAAVTNAQNDEMKKTLAMTLPALQRGQHAIRILTAVAHKYGGDARELRIPIGDADPTSAHDIVEWDLDREKGEIVVRYVKGVDPDAAPKVLDPSAHPGPGAS